MKNTSNENGLCGILPVYKPAGWTSFDVVAKLKGILHTRRIGHSGTLDPMATGVLPVFIGKATKACDMLPDSDKSYLAGFKLGLTTDTQDITGEVLSESSDIPTKDELLSAAKEFVGDIMQIPPMYSAVKVEGKKLYELAREGKTVERPAKPRHVESISIQEYDEKTGEGKLYTCVSKGTYIRTLIHDIGQKLGCGGVMTALERLSACGIIAQQCHTIEKIQQYADEGKVGELIKPLDWLFTYDRITLSERATKLYKNGVKLRSEQIGIRNASEWDKKNLCVFGADGEFLGIACINAQKNELRSIKNFY